MVKVSDTGSPEATSPDDAPEALAQFEPDPDGHDARPDEPATAPEGEGAADDDARWVAWPDAADEAAWANDGLGALARPTRRG